jgi:pimeloyl-ACP methyl ester carboxylesterase
LISGPIAVKKGGKHMAKERVERIGELYAKVYSPDSSLPKGAVVLVHGICMSSKIWFRWAERLASRGIEAWCLDLRGHGESGGQELVGQARIEDYAEDVEAALDAAGTQVVIGHDMGGLVAQVVANRRELRGLCLVGTVAPRGLTGRSNVLLLWRELRPRYVRAILQGKSWRPSKDDLIALTCGKLTPEDRDEVVSWLQPESGVAAREMSISGVPIDESKIRCPVLVAATTLDILTPPARQRQVASRLRADYVEFAQHAHFPMLEPGWERPIAVIGRWLEEAARVGEHNHRGSVSRMATRRSATGTPLPTPIPTPAAAPVAAPSASPSPPPSEARRSSVPPAGE